MTELETLLKSVEGRPFAGGSKERLSGAREALWMMQNHPETAFRCGPLALHRIKLATDPEHACTEIIHASASTQKGLSMPQVVELSRKVGLNYQMAFREKNGEFIVPSVVHWKAGHYAAIIRKSGDRYLVEDPTFGNSVWPTRQALETETSGYFLIPSGALPAGWRKVDATEGERVWGKGNTAANDGEVYACTDAQTMPCGAEGCTGMAVSSVHLMAVNVQIRDNPVGYAPPFGPPVRFLVRFNSRDLVNTYGVIADLSPLGLNWTHDWAAWIKDQPQSPMADVKYYVGGGGVRTFTGFNPTTQSFDFQQYDQTLLTRTGTNSYEMVWPDGSKKVFAQPDGSVGSTRRVYLSQIVDSAGNALSLTYQNYNNGFGPDLRLVAVTDALGQVTTLSYDLAADPTKITKVTDPFGRFATLSYLSVKIGTVVSGSPPVSHDVFGYAVGSITDVIGLTSQVTYQNNIAGQVNSLITPYGTNTFTYGGSGTTRFAEMVYPDGSRERVEYNQTVNIPSEPASQVPQGMATVNQYLNYRNTFYWNRNACATGYGDYSKAQVYHWLHTADMNTTSGILESTRQPLEGRVWRDYAGQSSSIVVGRTDQPAHIGRVLDDGSTQLYTYLRNGFGHITNFVDPVGRTFSYVYATNGIDLLEVRQTRASKNELLFRKTYDAGHRPLTVIDASGRTNIFTWNSRGQLLTETDPKGETTTFSYDTNGYLLAVDGPLPGTNDSVAFTYDSFRRPRTVTGLGGYSLTFDYDGMDRVTQITNPDGTYTHATYDRLALAAIRDRAGRTNFFDHNNMRQLTRTTDPLGRMTYFDWCTCGSLKSLTDPLGRMTTWITDVQGRLVRKQYADGSQVNYNYETTASRLRLVTDELLQATTFLYNRDNTLRSTSYGNTTVATPTVQLSYDPDYQRISSVTDGRGTTVYGYNPITTNTPSLGAGRLASEDGPLAQDTVTFAYDELGRAVQWAINGVEESVSYNAAGRRIGQTNALGAFGYAYDADSLRLLSQSFPNGLIGAITYGDSLQDFAVQQLSYSISNIPIAQFDYGYDIAKSRITTWSQRAGVQSPSVFTFNYDLASQLTSAVLTNGGVQVNAFAYGYDPAGNRLSEQANAASYSASFNSLNQISTTTAPASSRTNEWDAAHRLASVTTGNQRTEFTYDGRSRLAGIRQLINGLEVSHRLLVWTGEKIREERDTNGVVTKRYFSQGFQLLNGTNAGIYYYTRDHLGSVRELIDTNGVVRARYLYDPYGRRTRLSGNLDADFGFAGMFWCAEANLAFTHFRAYDPELGRWLSRDPLTKAEVSQGPNLYSYVRNDPINRTDFLGLCAGTPCMCAREPGLCAAIATAGAGGGAAVEEAGEALPVAAETLPGYASGAPEAMECAPGFADTLPPAFAQTAPQISNVPAQVLQNGEKLLNWDDYAYASIRLNFNEPYWSDLEGNEIFGEEAELLTENSGWANLYFDAAMDYLAKFGPPAGSQTEEIDNIMSVTSFLRGYILP
jgi:RHS repeat-associated protein